MEKLIVALVSPIIGIYISLMVMPSIMFPMAADNAASMLATSGPIIGGLGALLVWAMACIACVIPAGVGVGTAVTFIRG